MQRFPKLALAALSVLLAGCHKHPLTSGRATSAGIASAATRPSASSMNPATLIAALDSLRIAQRIPGLSVVVLQDTSIVFSHAFGLANIAQNIPVTLETPFNIASVSKPISAVVALRLVQNGLLTLDTPMQRFKGFNEFCESAGASGGVFFRDFECVGDKLTLRHVLAMTANGEPGTRFWYNPPSYSWASRPMAEVSGKTFSSLVDTLVFQPANMQQSARTNRALPIRADLAARLALPYHWDSSGKFVQSDPPPPQGDGAAGGVIATALDLAWFDIALTGNKLISADLKAQLFAGTKTSSGATLPYGLGFFLGELNGHRVAWHTGLWDGQYSALYLKVLTNDTHEPFTFVLLANSDGLKWDTRLDEAAIERSPFAQLLMRTFVSSPRWK